MAITITSGSVQNIPEGAFFTGEAYGVPEESPSTTFVYLCEATGSTATQQFPTGQYRWTIDENYADGADFEVGAYRRGLGPFYFQVKFTRTNIDAETDQTVYTFRLTAEDMDGESATQDVTIYVIDVDDTPPTITSSNSVSIVENTGTQQVVYTVTSDDSEDVLPYLTMSAGLQAVYTPFTRYAFGETGRDNSDFTIDFETGEVTLGVNPNYEEKSEYIFSVVAYDRGDWRYSGHETNYTDEFFVTLNVVNVDESGPVITSGATTGSINEDSGAGQVVYTATATDVDSNSENPTFVFSLGVGADNSHFNIDSATGEVTLIANPNFEAKNQYSFSVFATDEAGNVSIEQIVTLNINFVDTYGPNITSGYIGAIVDENSGAGQIVYVATADDTNGATFSLLDTTLGFSIDANTGVVTTNADFVADYETATEQQITIVATDDLGNSTQQLITIRIRNINESAPTITSGDTSDRSVPEGSPAGFLVYNATYDVTEDVGDVTWSLADTSLGFGITQLNNVGYVQTNSDFVADFQVAQSQSFTVVATSDNGTVSQKVVTVPITIVVENPAPGQEAVLGVNPDYATLLPLIASTPPGNLRDERIAKCFKFNTPLTTAEKELFDYVNYLFLDFVPTPEFLANNPSSNSDSYVGDYVGFPPGVISVSDSELPPSDIPSPDPDPDLEPNPDPDDPDPTPVPEPEPDPDIPSPEPDQETEVPEIIVPSPVLGATGPDPTLPLSGGAVFVSSTGKILLDADGNPLRLEDINYSANDINIRLDNIITG